MFIRISFLVLGGLLLLFGGTILIDFLFLPLFGVHFLPSEDWIVRTAPAASHVGVVLGACASALMIGCALKNPAILSQPHFRKRPRLKLLAATFFMGFVAWLACTVVVENGVPMTHAILAGTKVTLPYTVEDPQYYGSRKCRSAIKLDGMLGTSKLLCGVPDSLRNALSKGDTIYAVGRGTSNGVFYTGFALSPAD